MSAVFRGIAWFLLPLFCLFFTQGAQAFSLLGDKINLDGLIQGYNLAGGDAFNLNHQAYFRRARIIGQGKLNSYFTYRVEYDFARQPEWRNVWVNYQDKHNDVRAGQFKPPFNPEFNESAMYIWFSEIALPVLAFNPNFRRAVSYNFFMSHFNIAASVFSPGTQMQAKVNKPYGGTVQFDYVIYQQGAHLMQLGLSDWYQKADNTGHISYGTMPEARGYMPVKTVNTGTISNVNHANTYSLSLLFQYQRLASSMGVIRNITERNGAGNLSFGGAYGQLSVFLTPNYLTFNRVAGVFSSPNNRRLAFQLSGRVSEVDLNSHSVQGGKELNESLSLNSYFLQNFKVGLEYIHAKVTASTTTTNASDNIGMLVFQYMF